MPGPHVGARIVTAQPPDHMSNDLELAADRQDIEGAETGGGESEQPPEPQDRHDAPSTGLDAVDRILDKAASVNELPVHERAAAYRQLHSELEVILNQQPGSLPAGLTGQ